MGIVGCQEEQVIQRMVDGTINDPFKQNGSQFVHRLESGHGTLFLKRTEHEPARHVLRHLLRGRKAYTNCGWTNQAIVTLKGLGFDVMEPVAWAEQRWFGLWPRRGFLLVTDVGGQEMSKVLNDPELSPLRTRAFRTFGALLGRLHGNGIYYTVRPHDVFIRKTPALRAIWCQH